MFAERYETEFAQVRGGRLDTSSDPRAPTPAGWVAALLVVGALAGVISLSQLTGAPAWPVHDMFPLPWTKFVNAVSRRARFTIAVTQAEEPERVATVAPHMLITIPHAHAPGSNWRFSLAFHTLSGQWKRSRHPFHCGSETVVAREPREHTN